ncbi:MAG: hypothetical protein EP344_00915, partial [Bacteroidetes bacterium]
YSPDGKYVVTAGADRTAKVWEVNNKKVVLELPGAAIASFSPNGEQIVTADGKTAIIWSAQTGKKLQELSGHKKEVWSAIFSPDSRYVLTASLDKTACLWSKENGQRLHNFSGHRKGVWSATFSPDGKNIVTSSSDNAAYIWDVQTGLKMRELSGHKGEIFSAKYSPDGSKIVTASFDGTAKVWNVQTGKEIHELKGHRLRVWSAEFSPDSRNIVTAGNDKKAIIWKASSGQNLQVLTGHSDGVRVATYSPDGKHIVTTGNFSNWARIWDTQTGNQVSALKGYTESIVDAVISPDNKQYIMAGGDGNIKVWDIQKGMIQDMSARHRMWLYSVALSPNGKYYASSSGDSTAILWDRSSNRQFRILKGHTNEVSSVDFSPNSKQVVTASADETARVWDIETGNQKLELKGHSGWVSTAQYNLNGDLILTASFDSTARIWDARTGKELLKIKQNNSIQLAQFIPERQQIFIGGYEGQAGIWSVQTGKKIWELPGHKGSINSAHFSPDGKHLATGGDDKSIRIWDIETGQQLRVIQAHRNWVMSTQYSPNGILLYTTSTNGSFKLWSTDQWKELVTVYPIDSIDHVAIHPSGLFDATPGAMDKMYYLLGLEIIEFEQLKERYYEPGLYQKVMKGEPLRDVQKFESLDMYPIMKPQIKDDTLGIHLQIRNGGVGKTSIFINNKEVLADANLDRDTVLSIDLKAFAKFYLPDTVNQIGIRTWNAAGWLKSQLYTLDYVPRFLNQKGQDGVEPLTHKENYQPHYYAIVVGTSDYNGDQLDLRYADKDANDMKLALGQTAQLLFGAENVHLEWFSTDTQSGSKLASKEHIKAAFDTFALTARPEDVLTIYFSGHGTTYGGTENEQFYYLTKDCFSGDLSDPAIRNNYAISTEELTEWVNAIPARKQVMILDACSSGKVVEDLLAIRNVPTSQIRALDRMKDRTGMFVLAGSAADKVSYEASQFGQGLLTYSLLLGMRGAALRENRSVDVMQLFQFARDKVPEFAGDIGGIQTPTLASPQNASSFDIGLVTEGVEIPLEEVKPVFIRSSFFNDESLGDEISLSGTLDAHLLDMSAGLTPRGIIFVDVNRYKNAYQVRGRYLLSGDQIKLIGRLFRDNEVVGEFELQGSKTDLDSLVNDILAEVKKILE